MSTSRKTTRPRLSREGVGVWTASEHARFLEALELYPHGPWKLVAAYIGTRSTRQAMTHAQKYRQKLERRRRGLRNAQSKQLEPISQLLASETFENETIMLNFERLLAADEETWCCVEPIPLTIPHATDRAELEWIDDCFSYFVENFSC